MECSKCKHQFCWYCLDAFYTEYHFNQTNCPFRYCFLHTIEVLCLVLLVAKVCCLSSTMRDYLLLALDRAWHLLAAALLSYQVCRLVKLYERKGRKKRELERIQRSTSRSIYISADTRRRLRARTRVVEKLELRLKKGAFQLASSIFVAYLLSERVALDFNRVVSLFVLGTIGCLLI